MIPIVLYLKQWYCQFNDNNFVSVIYYGIVIQLYYTYCMVYMYTLITSSQHFLFERTRPQLRTKVLGFVNCFICQQIVFRLQNCDCQIIQFALNTAHCTKCYINHHGTTEIDFDTNIIFEFLRTLHITLYSNSIQESNNISLKEVQLNQGLKIWVCEDQQPEGRLDPLKQ